MKPRPQETPAEIAARYGAVCRVEAVTVVPRGVSAFDPVTGVCWKDGRDKRMKALGKMQRMKALQRREQRAREEAAETPERMVQIAPPTKKPRPKKPATPSKRAEAKRQRAQSREAAKAKRRAIMAELIWMGETIEGAGRLMGMHPSAAQRMARKIRDLGYALPENLAERNAELALRRGNSARVARAADRAAKIRALLADGVRIEDAAAACGFSSIDYACRVAGIPRPAR